MALARISITLPRDVLAAADRRARELDRSRSWVVAEAVREYVGRPVAVREATTVPYGKSADLGPYRLRQLTDDLALTPEQRVREAEETARVSDLVAGPRKPRGVWLFDRYEDYLEWQRREDVGA